MNRIAADVADGDRLLYPREVASIFRVDAKTVARWSRSGLLACVLLPSGHRRYRESEVRALLEGAPPAQKT